MESLPIDIFQEIIERVVQTPRVVGDPPISDERLRRICSLLETCRRWRDVLYATPSLWTYIQLPHQLTDRTADYVRVRLERSGASPLNLFMHEGMVDSMHAAHRAHFQQCFDLVATHHLRIRGFAFSASLLEPETLDIFMQPWPLLQELIMTPNKGRAENLLIDHWDEDRRFFQGCPELRRLDSHIACMIPSQTLSRLTRFTISLRDIPHAPLWLSLAMTPALEDLQIYFPDSGWGPDYEDELAEELDLPQLKTLSVFGYPCYYNWTTKLLTPALKTLIVSVEYCNRSRELFRAFGNRIRHLVIVSVETDPSSGWLNMSDAVALDELSSLDTFELRDISEDMITEHRQSFFGYFTEQVQKSQGASWAARCPTVILRDCKVPWDACGTLVDFVRARHAAAAEHGRPLLRLDLGGSTFAGSSGSWRAAGFSEVAMYFEHALEDQSDDETEDPPDTPNLSPSPSAIHPVQASGVGPLGDTAAISTLFGSTHEGTTITREDDSLGVASPS